MYNNPANSSRTGPHSGETKPVKVYLYIYSIIVSSETILKLAQNF